MTWLLLEILVFVVAAAGFGVLIGLGLAAAGAKRKGPGHTAAHPDLLDRLQSLELLQRTVEVKAEARSAAEAAVRGDLEGRLLEIEAEAADYRARAEAAERQLRRTETSDYGAPIMASAPASDSSAEMAEREALRAAVAEAEAGRERAERACREAEAARDAVAAAATAAGVGAAEDRARSRQEIESLGVQLAAAERVRARCEAELALAHARAAAVMRSAAALMGAADPQAPAAQAWTPPAAPGESNGNGAYVPPATLPDEAGRPAGLDAPRDGGPDDLRRIRGIGPRNANALNALGLYHYEQIAALSERNVAWLDAYFRFPGRITREDWIGQAKALADARAEPEISDKVRPEDAGF